MLLSELSAEKRRTHFAGLQRRLRRIVKLAVDVSLGVDVVKEFVCISRYRSSCDIDPEAVEDECARDQFCLDMRGPYATKD